MLGRVGQEGRRETAGEGTSMSGLERKIRFWTRGISPLALLTSGSLLAGLLILYACQDNPELTGPSAATATIAHKLTILPAGNGTGKVVSSPTGISCQITNGVAAATGCSKLMSGTVTLTATPVLGHAFAGWMSSSSTCTGTGGCKIGMSVDRNVTAKFNKGPFTIKISSVATTGGSGTVKLAVGTTVKTCTITNGTLGSTTACSISAAANKLVTPPVVVVHAHQLSTGKVLLWGDTGGAYLWGAPKSFELLTAKPFRLYCSGHGFLPDGRLLIVGGTDSRTGGLRDATL